MSSGSEDNEIIKKAKKVPTKDEFRIIHAANKQKRVGKADYCSIILREQYDAKIVSG